jgi:hypothetical protein
MNTEKIEQLAVQVRVLANSLLDDGYSLSLKDPPSLESICKIQQLTEIVHEKAGDLLVELRRKPTAVTANKVTRRSRKSKVRS